MKAIQAMRDIVEKRQKGASGPARIAAEQTLRNRHRALYQYCAAVEDQVFPAATTYPTELLAVINSCKAARSDWNLKVDAANAALGPLYFPSGQAWLLYAQNAALYSGRAAAAEKEAYNEFINTMPPFV
jgi:hypothetical protein